MSHWQRVRRWPTRLLAASVAFIVLSGAECDPGELGIVINQPGTIVVANGGSEAAVLAVTTDDARSYPTLPGGGSASVVTNVGGGYRVRVLMTPENAKTYRADLLALRKSVTDMIAGSASAADRTRLFVELAGIKSQLLELEQGGSAGCDGAIRLSPDSVSTVHATVQWVAEGEAGFWDATCASN
jgi:hypothetical protein